MTTTTRGKIEFIMPDSWTEEQTNSFADKVIEKAKPRIIKLSKPDRPDSYTTESVGHDKHHKSPKESDK